MFRRLKQWLSEPNERRSSQDPSPKPSLQPQAFRLSLLFVIAGFGVLRDRYVRKAPPLLAVGWCLGAADAARQLRGCRGEPDDVGEIAAVTAFLWKVLKEAFELSDDEAARLAGEAIARNADPAMRASIEDGGRSLFAWVNRKQVMSPIGLMNYLDPPSWFNAARPAAPPPPACPSGTA